MYSSTSSSSMAKKGDGDARPRDGTRPSNWLASGQAGHAWVARLIGSISDEIDGRCQVAACRVNSAGEQIVELVITNRLEIGMPPIAQLPELWRGVEHATKFVDRPIEFTTCRQRCASAAPQAVLFNSRCALSATLLSVARVVPFASQASNPYLFNRRLASTRCSGNPLPLITNV